jgi:hypothetical protein
VYPDRTVLWKDTPSLTSSFASFVRIGVLHKDADQPAEQ